MRVSQVDFKPERLKKIRKATTSKKPRPRRDLRTMFRQHLATIDIEKMKKPWMASKAFRLITDKETLWEWARSVVSDKSRYHLNPIAKQEMPVIACDTENTGLDTRIITLIDEQSDGTLTLRYEVNIEIAGICLSADGIEGLYVPINHERGAWVPPVYDQTDPTKVLEEGHWGPAVNISREDVAEVLQWLFDQCHLIFYNAKYDREVIRITLGINLRGYPYFEDVQVLQYINDPKADLGDKGRGQYTGDSGGLKSLSKNLLDLEQIHSEELLKIKADFFNPAENKTTLRVQYAPFTWLPTEVALWYAAADSICTWLLWFGMKDKARERGLVHRIDHEMVESLTYLERQRFIVDVAKHKRTVNWHERMLTDMKRKLREMALKAGYDEQPNPDGTVDPENRFNPDSNPKLADFFFNKNRGKKFDVVRLGKLYASVDSEVIEELKKRHPDDDFLKLFSQYKKYVALHPENLRYDTRDNSARIYLKQNVVAGGRLSAAGGDFDVDGGFGLNPQGIKRVEGNWWVRGNILEPDEVPEDQVEPYEPTDLHPSCYKEVEEEYVVEEHDEQKTDWETGAALHNPLGGAPVMDHVVKKAKRKVRKQAPGIIKNHIGNYMGYAICLVPKCTTCAERHGILIPDSRMDANQVVNIRTLMIAPPGWTFFTIDYCLAPETRLLTSDLHWKTSGDIQIGEELIGFDENRPSGRGRKRKFRKSIVEEKQMFQLPCVRITTNKGVFTCFKNHEWLGKTNYKGSDYKFIASKDLKPGYRIARMCHPWEMDTTYTGGYLAGVYDGEGHIAPQAFNVSQKPGMVLNRIKNNLREKGFGFRSNEDNLKDYDSGVATLSLEGGRPEYLRFLGSLRPSRLLKNGRKLWENTACSSQYSLPDEIISVEDAGVQEVVGIRTSTHTYIAEGLLSHNCNIEMRAAANVSGEPEFIKEFLEGKGDFHALTASKVFPAFNDPSTDAATKKKLRSRAKILNFALLYGGTAYTVFENMKKEDPNITFEDCQKMVEDYWAGVPVFAEFCNKKQTIAKEKMTCTTSTGRIIYFKSAMEALGIHIPTEEEKDNYYQYRNLVKKEEEAKKQGNEDLAAKCKVLYDRMWKDQTTGVRNYQDYNRFMGKIQRVAVNVPLQGLAGDFMRISLNRIRAWALSHPWIQAIFRLFCSVHDEIDFAVKNEYVPFVIPRITRLMKLRKYHEKMKWSVPIECDCEYGTSWDVEHHLTGDDGHKPAGWSKVPGMANYIPDGVDPVDIKTLRDAIISGNILRKDQAAKFLKENLHERCAEAIKTALAATDSKAALAAVIVAFQLDEYWKVDHTPDGADDTMETLEQFEARNSLTPKDRGVMPEMGFLGAIPLKANVKRPTLMILGKEVPAEDVQITVSDSEITVEEPSQHDGAVAVSKCEDCDPAHECPGPQPDEDVIGDIVKKKPVVAERISMQPPLTPSVPGQEIPDLIDMDEATTRRFKAAMGVGRNKVRIRYQGTVLDLGDVLATKIPDEFVKKEQPIGV